MSISLATQVSGHRNPLAAFVLLLRLFFHIAEEIFEN
jgi:hypothetical protein